MHFRHDVLAVDADVGVARSAQRDVQHGALLGDVDRRAGEHRLAHSRKVRARGEAEEKRHRLRHDAVLRIVERKIAVGDGEAREALRVGGKQLAELRIADRGSMRAEILERGIGGGFHAAFPSRAASRARLSMRLHSPRAMASERRHPRAADADDVGERQIRGGVLAADAAGRAEADRRKRRGKRLQVGDAAGGFGGKEFLDCVAGIHQLHHFRGRGGAGHQRHRRVLRRLQEIGIGSGRDEEARAGPRGGDELAFAQHRSGADDRAFDLAGDSFDRRDRGPAAERDLDDGEAAGDKRASERDGGSGILDRDDGNDRDAGQDRLKFCAAAHPVPHKAIGLVPAAVFDHQALAFRLADRREHFAEPGCAGVEGLAALDARQLDRPERPTPFLVVADQARPAAKPAFDREIAMPRISRRSSSFAAAERAK